MKDDNIFLWVKAVIAAACGAFTAAFGWLGWLVVGSLWQRAITP